MHVYMGTGNWELLGTDVVGTGNLRAFFPCMHAWELSEKAPERVGIN